MTHISEIITNRFAGYFSEERKIPYTTTITKTTQKTKERGVRTYSYESKQTKNVKHMSINSFLRLPLDERLPLITSPSVHIHNLHEHDKIFFDFHKNIDLEQSISLSELMPKTIRSLLVGKNLGRRNIVTGEYITDSECRLSVCNGSVVTIGEIQLPSATQELRKKELTKIVQKLTLNDFFDLPFAERLQMITEKAKNPREVQKGDTLVINFYNNSELEDQIGLCEVLPQRITGVEVTDNSGRKEVGYRNKNRFFMTEKEKRLVILSGFRVKIIQ